MPWEYTYEPFGATQVSGAPSASPFHFTGRENDGTGLYYYRARYYSPQWQRFLSEDPLEFDGGDLNLHAYTSDNPVNYTDPSGELFIPVVVGCAVGAGFSIGWDVLAGRKIDWIDAGIGCAVGAIGGLSGPKGPLFGRARYRNGIPGILNRGDNLRVGWSWNASRGRNMFGVHGGIPRTPNHWHWTPVPGPRGPLW
jgi:RHS repeat-associated protein